MVRANSKEVAAGKKSPGRAAMARHLAGKKIGRKAAMEAKCFDCCAGYADGKQDCRCPRCPLYSWMPYREV